LHRDTGPVISRKDLVNLVRIRTVSGATLEDFRNVMLSC
jgi:hypothetical protein